VILYIFLSCCRGFNKDEIWGIMLAESPKKIFKINNKNVNKQKLSGVSCKGVFTAHCQSRYYMLKINNTRTGHMPQLSKIVFRDIKQNIIVPKGMYSQYPEPINNEQAHNLISTGDKYSSKWYAGQNHSFSLESLLPFPFEVYNICVVVEFTTTVHIAQYKFITANDCLERDPVHWDWYIGIETPKFPILDIWDANWVHISTTKDANAPSGRFLHYPTYRMFD